MTELDVVIIGSGFSGLGMAISLQQEGKRRYVVLEKGAGVGGTWRENHYPGCACDVPSHLYSFSFAQNPSWSASLAGSLTTISAPTSVALCLAPLTRLTQ